MSQNMTVKCRRSATCGDGSRPDGSSVARTFPRTSRTSPMPHWPQKLALGSFSVPQAAQVSASGAPHLLQNLFPALVSAPQLGHLMGFPAMAQPNHTSTGSTSITITWSGPIGRTKPQSQNPSIKCPRIWSSLTLSKVVASAEPQKLIALLLREAPFLRQLSLPIVLQSPFLDLDRIRARFVRLPCAPLRVQSSPVGHAQATTGRDSCKAGRALSPPSSVQQ